jgi:hypothetical protein
LGLDVPLALDFGVAVYPNDGESKDALIRLADERLYELKNSTRNQPAPSPAPTARVIPMEPPSARETPPAAHAPAAPAFTAPAVPPAAFPPAPRGSERRKWERVSLVGTRAHAVIGEANELTARVMDMSYGGVALLVDHADKLPNVFPAVLHVPILPPVKVSLRKSYVEPAEGQKYRVGCAFLP